MSENRRFLISSLLVFVLWVTIIFGVTLLQTGGKVNLDSLVSNQVVYALVLAPSLLFVFVFYYRNKYKFGFTYPVSGKSLLLLLFPVILPFLFLFYALMGDIPPIHTIGFILLNTVLVGISEELMFRGILYESFIKQFSLNRTILFTALLFGAVHSLNGFLTGNFTNAFAQSIQAMMFGFWILVLRIRIGSIFPVMIVHALWDFSIILLAQGSKPLENSNPSNIEVFAFPIILELPLFLYGLWLLKRLRANS